MVAAQEKIQLPWWQHTTCVPRLGNVCNDIRIAIAVFTFHFPTDPLTVKPIAMF